MLEEEGVPRVAVRDLSPVPLSGVGRGPGPHLH